MTKNHCHIFKWVKDSKMAKRTLTISRNNLTTKRKEVFNYTKIVIVKM